jgi:hypothetical protein
MALATRPEARRAVGNLDVEELIDSKPMKRAKARPSVVFRKLAGLKKEWAGREEDWGR